MTESETELPSIKRVGLFGGTGFVGSHLVDALISSDYHPVLLVRDGNASDLD